MRIACMASALSLCVVPDTSACLGGAEENNEGGGCGGRPRLLNEKTGGPGVNGCAGDPGLLSECAGGPVFMDSILLS